MSEEFDLFGASSVSAGVSSPDFLAINDALAGQSASHQYFSSLPSSAFSDSGVLADFGGALNRVLNTAIRPEDQAAANQFLPDPSITTLGTPLPVTRLPDPIKFTWNPLGTALSSINPFGFNPQQPKNPQAGGSAGLLLIGALLLIVIIASSGGRK